jgi:cobalamin biosynthesis Co2+ chelatase CbiK
MSVKLFEEITEDTNFIVNGTEYKKIPLESVSCCKKFNAIILSTQAKVFVAPKTEIEVADEQK